MKNKIEILALVLSILCVCVTGAVFAVSSSKMKAADEKITALESEIEEMEYMQAEGEMETEPPKAEKPGEKDEEAASDGEIELGETEAETKAQTEIAAEETEAGQENGYTVAIDPGHQGSWVDMSDQEPNGPGSSTMKAKATTGTQGKFTGIPEYALNLDISLALQTELESRGYRVIMTRTDNDTAISNSERALKASEEGGDVYVRIHANGSEDSSVSGALGMAPSYDNPYVGALAEDSYRLAECILNAYCAETGFGNLGIQYYDDMTGINWSQIPVMILEMGFMTNQHDDTAMADEAMREKMVEGIANGIDQYFGR